MLKESVLPAGLGADKAGNVFIPDSGSSSILEFAHGSTHLVARLEDRRELPYSCAADPLTGDLAVVNYESAVGAGGVSIYAHAKGAPKKYVDDLIYFYLFATYDDSGNLFIDAQYDEHGKPFAFLELRKGGHALAAIVLHHHFKLPGGVAWDGRDIAVGDPRAGNIYRFEIQGRHRRHLEVSGRGRADQDDWRISQALRRYA